MQRMRRNPWNTWHPGWDWIQRRRKPRNAHGGMRLKSREKFIQQGHPGRGSNTESLTLSTCRRLSRPTQTPPAPAQPGFPHSHQARSLRGKIVTPSLEQIISVPRRWGEHHEKKEGGQKGLLGVSVSTPPAETDTRIRQLEPTRGPTRMGADPTNSSIRPSQLTRRMTGDWMSHPHLDPGPSFVQIS
jgi:hypothetical protein